MADLPGQTLLAFLTHHRLFGHKLNADSKESKHFLHVLAENDLVIVPSNELYLSMPETALTALKKYGPIMIGGLFYKVLGKKFGHYIILAGVDTDVDTYLIYDPAKKSPEWISASLVHRNWWGSMGGSKSAESAFAVDPAKQVERTGIQGAEVVSRLPRG